jgi:hypothetical protein
MIIPSTKWNSTRQLFFPILYGEGKRGKPTFFFLSLTSEALL